MKPSPSVQSFITRFHMSGTILNCCMVVRSNMHMNCVASWKQQRQYIYKIHHRKATLMENKSTSSCWCSSISKELHQHSCKNGRTQCMSNCIELWIGEKKINNWNKDLCKSEIDENCIHERSTSLKQTKTASTSIRTTGWPAGRWLCQRWLPLTSVMTRTGPLDAGSA
jgi:hypothetical protein